MTNEAAVRRVDAAMPTLALDTSLRSKRQLGILLGVHGPNTPPGSQIADGFIRVVQKTILEYQSSREKLITFLENGFADDYFRSQDHFESSILSLHRAIAYLERFRQMGFRQSNGAPFVPRPRDLKVLSEGVKTKIRNFRDSVEHLDKDIIVGLIPHEAEIGVHLGWEKASLNGNEITYAEFVRWIGQLHHFAELLSRVQITIDAAPPSLKADS